MSDVIVEKEERVLSMRFDNEQFKKESKNTLTILERLKSALSSSTSAKALDDLNKAAEVLSDDGLSSIQDSLAAIEKRFSTLGIVGMRVIENLTDSAIGYIKKASSYVANSVKSGGVRRAFNIENAHFSLQMLLKDEEQVQAIMDDAMESVNDTAYAYDEAAAAAAQFAATGYRSGQKMQDALKGIVGVAAMTNSEYSSISRIFTTVAGNGRLMGDQLLQLSSRGLNAAATIADYFREVRGEASMTEAKIREMVSKGKISFDTFAQAMNWAFGEGAYRANETFNGAMSNMKSALSRIGAEFVSPLIAQNSKVVELINATRIKINELKKVLTFDDEIRGFRSFSKQFTGFVLKMSENLTKFVGKIDFEASMETIYYTGQSVLNVLKGIGSIIKPIGSAFKEIFLTFDQNDVRSAAKDLELFTRNLKVSGVTANNIKDTFKGLFAIVKGGIDVLGALLYAILPVTDPLGTLLYYLVALTGEFGRFIQGCAQWIRENKILQNSIRVIVGLVFGFIKVVFDLVEAIYLLIKAISDIPVVHNIILLLGSAFEYLGTVVLGLIQGAADGIELFANKISKMSEEIRNSKINTIAALFGYLFDKIKSFSKFIGLDKALKQIKSFFSGMSEAISSGKVPEKLDEIKQKLTEFGIWIRDKFGPMFKGFNLSNLIAGGISVGMLAGLLKLVGALKSITNPLHSLTGMMDAFSKSMEADATLKNAKAIAILAASLTLLSLVDTDKLFMATIALSALTVAMIGMANAIPSLRKPATTFADVSMKLVRALGQLTKAVKWRMISKAIRNAALAFSSVILSLVTLSYVIENHESAVMKSLMVVGSIIALLTTVGIVMAKSSSIMQKGPTLGSQILALSVSLYLIMASLARLFKINISNDWPAKIVLLTSIFGLMAGLVVAIGYAGKISKGNAFNTGKSTILSLAIFLKITANSLKDLMKVDFSAGKVIGSIISITGIFTALSIAILAIGKANEFAGGKIRAARSLLSMVALMLSVVSSIKILSKVPLWGYIKGLIAVSAIMVLLRKIVTSMAFFEKGTGAWKSVLALTIGIASITMSLSILSLINWDKLIPATIALGTVLYTLSKSLDALSKFKKSTRTIKALVVLAALIPVLITIAITMAKLSGYNWGSLISSAIGIGGVLYALSSAIQMLHSTSWSKYDPKKVGNLLLFSLTLAPIVVALSAISGKDWKGLIASAASIGIVINILAESYQKVLEKNWIKGSSIKKVSTFLMMAAGSLTGIGLAIGLLAKLPWQGMISAASSISIAVLGLAEAFTIISKSKSASPVVVGSFLGCALSLIEISAAIAIIAEHPWKNLIGAAASMSIVLAVLTGALVALSAAAPIINAAAPFLPAVAVALLGIGAIAAILETFVLAGLPSMGSDLAGFAINAEPFFTIMGNLPPNTAKNIKEIAVALLAFTGSGFLEGIKDFFGSLFDTVFGDKKSSLEKFGEELSELGKHVGEYAAAIAPYNMTKLRESSVAIDELSKSMKMINGSTIVIGDPKLIMDNLGIFINGLNDLAPSVVKYSETVSKINPDSIQGSQTILESLAALANKLPKTAGVLTQLFVGNYTLSDFGYDLAEMGGYFKEYSDTVTGLDRDALMTASSSIGEMIELCLRIKELGVNGTELDQFVYNFSTISSYGLDGFIQEFEDKMPEVNETIDSFVAGVAALLQNDFESAKESIYKTAYELGSYHIQGFQDGLSDSRNLSKIKGAAETAANLVDSTFRDTLGIHSPGIKGFIIGSMHMAGVINGIASKIPEATQISEEAGTAIKLGVGNGMFGMIDLANSAMGDVNLVVKDGAVGIANDTESMMDDVNETIESAFEEAVSSVESSLESIGETTKTIFRDVNDEVYESIDALAEHYHTTADKLVEGTHSATVAIARMTRQLTREEIINGVRNQALDEQWANEHNKYNNMPGSDPHRDAMNQTTNYALQAAANQALLYEELGEQILSEYENDSGEIWGESLGNYSSAIKKKEELFQDDIDSEQSHWSDLLRIRREGIDKEKYQEMTLLEFKKEIQVESADLLNEYIEQLETQQDSYMKQIDLFDAVDEKEAKTKEELTNNLKDQIDAYHEYNSVLKSLNDRLGDSELGEYIRTLGIDNLGELKSINSMTDDELSQYVDLYNQKMAEASYGATLQLKDLQTSIETQLEDLFGVAKGSVNLFDFAESFDTSFESIDEYVSGILYHIGNSLSNLTVDGADVGEAIEAAFAEVDGESIGQNIGANLSAGVATGMINDKSTTAIKNSSEEVISSVESALQDAADIHSPSKRMDTNVGEWLTEGVASGMIRALNNEDGIILSANTVIDTIETTMTSDENLNKVLEAVMTIVTLITTTIQNNYSLFKEEGEKITEKLSNGIDDGKNEYIETSVNSLITKITSMLTAAASDMYEIGKQAAGGYLAGFSEAVPSAEQLGERLGKGTVTSTAMALDEHSPSKEMDKVARYAGIGYLNRLMSYVSIAYQAGEQIGENTVGGIESSVRNALSSMGEDQTFHPVIQPVFDMSNTYRAASELSSMMDKAIDSQRVNALTIGSSIERTNIDNKTNAQAEDASEGKNGGIINISMNQTNNSPKALSEIDIYRNSRMLLSQFAKGLKER